MDTVADWRLLTALLNGEIVQGHPFVSCPNILYYIINVPIGQQ